jgi:hypothetical protein
VIRLLDALTRRRGAAGRERNGHIELRPSDHEEPTWEVRHPGDRGRRRWDGRTRAILSLAAVAAVAVNAGAAWIYWRVTDSQTGNWGAATTVELALRARSDLNHPLIAGQRGLLAVTVTNDYDVPIRITSVTPGAGAIIVDPEHREAGCTNPRVRLSRARFAVSWEVPRNTIGAFTLADALVMRPDAAPACDGGVFTVPIQASGSSHDPS